MTAHSEVSHLPVTEKEIKPRQVPVQKTSFSEHILVHFTSSHKNKHDKNEQNTSEICAHTQVPTTTRKSK